MLKTMSDKKIGLEEVIMQALGLKSLPSDKNNEMKAVMRVTFHSSSF